MKALSYQKKNKSVLYNKKKQKDVQSPAEDTRFNKIVKYN